MVLIVSGCFFLAFPIALSVWAARALRMQGRPTSEVWRFLARSPMTWLGVTIVLTAINQTAGGVAFLLVVLAFGSRLVLLTARGIHGLPETWRKIGDPEAWRGHR